MSSWQAAGFPSRALCLNLVEYHLLQDMRQEARFSCAQQACCPPLCCQGLHLKAAILQCRQQPSPLRLLCFMSAAQRANCTREASLLTQVHIVLVGNKAARKPFWELRLG